jgi:uracil-DNA glycosylase
MKIHEFIRIQRKNRKFNKFFQYIQREYEEKKICPSYSNIFECFLDKDIEDFHVIILGFEPYSQPDIADGFAFSCTNGKRIPSALEIIFNELKNDTRVERNTSSLRGWAQQGVLLLNMCLTVEENKPLSHSGKGWEDFSLNLIYHYLESEKPVLFVLMGERSQELLSLIRPYNKHKWIISAYPSALTANVGFYGSRIFSRINRFMDENGYTKIDWAK